MNEPDPLFIQHFPGQDVWLGPIEEFALAPGCILDGSGFLGCPDHKITLPDAPSFLSHWRTYHLGLGYSHSLSVMMGHLSMIRDLSYGICCLKCRNTYYTESRYLLHQIHIGEK